MRSAVINDESGQPVFEQHGIEVPTTWSQTATNIVASKYFRGQLGSPERETQRAAADLARGGHDHAAGPRSRATSRPPRTSRSFSRRADAPARPPEGRLQQPGLVQRRHREAPAGLGLLHQLRQRHHGVDPRPGQDRGHALQVRLGHGLEPLRASAPRKEPLAGGGTASGPVSFMRGYDAFAGVIKSGGKTRRAAKMVILERRPSRHRGVHQLQGRRREEGLGADRRRLRRRLQRARAAPTTPSSSRTPTTPCASPTSSCARWSRTREWQTRYVLDGRALRDLPGPRPHEEDGRGGLAVRRSRACSSTPPSTTGTPARTRRASTPATRAREYMFLDDTACNLASLNLMKFRDARTASSTSRPSRPPAGRMITAQEILVDNASYPTPAIDENSHDYRPLGLGYANLGVLLMDRGPALRLRRRPRLRGGDHRADARRGLRPERARRRGHGPVRRLRAERASRCCG